MNEQKLNPTVPNNRDIFSSTSQGAQTNLSGQQNPPIDKKQVIARVSGKKFSTKNIFIVLGLIVFVLFILVVVKIIGRSNQPQQTNLTWWALE